MLSLTFQADCQIPLSKTKLYCSILCSIFQLCTGVFRERKYQYNLEKDLVFYKIPKRNLLWASSPKKKEVFVLQNILKPIEETENNLTLILPL